MVRLRYDLVVAAAMPLCGAARDMSAAGFLEWVRQDRAFRRFEFGAMSAKAFFAHFKKRLKFDGNFAEFTRIWRKLLTPNSEMIRFVAGLRDRCEIYYLSNSNTLHVPYVYELFPALRVHRDDAISCELGKLKPSPAFFEKALAKFGISAVSCLFVDDDPANVAGAEACGIEAVLHETNARTMALLARRLRGARPTEAMR